VINDALMSAVPLRAEAKDEQAGPGQLALYPEALPDANPKATAEPDE
jgi:hypothetical protein